MKAIKSIKKRARKGGKAFAHGVEKVGTNVADAGQQASDQAKKTLKDTGDVIKKNVTPLADAAKNTTRQASDTAKQTLQATGDVIKKNVTPLADAAKNTSRQASDTTKKTMKATGDVIKKNVGPIMGVFPQTKPPSALRDTTTTTTSDPSDDLTTPMMTEVEPDETLQNMNIILKKRIGGGITVEQFYKTIWEKPEFYFQWLQASGKTEIQVGEWTFSEGGPDSPFAFVSTWKDDNTSYGRIRNCEFSFTRTTHLYTGPPVAQVKQTHWGRLTDDGDRCIIHLQVDMEGIPFANCFNVQIRWVATRIPTTTKNISLLQIEVGLHVNFVEQTILAGKIRSGTTEETTKTQKSLLQAVLKECSMKNAGGGGDEGLSLLEIEEDDQEDDNELDNMRERPCFFGFLPRRLFGGSGGGRDCMPFFFFRDQRSDHRTDAIGSKTQSIQRKLQQLIDRLDMLDGDLDTEIQAKVESELTDVQEALGTIDRYLKLNRVGQYKSSRHLL